MRYPDRGVDLFSFRRFFVLHLRHLLRQTRGIFFVLDIINRESAEHVVRVVLGPILIGIRVGHF